MSTIVSQQIQRFIKSKYHLVTLLYVVKNIICCKILHLVINSDTDEKYQNFGSQGKMASYRAPENGGGNSIGGRTGEV